MFDRLPASLRVRLNLSLKTKLVKAVPFLSNLEDSTMAAIVERLKSAQAIQGELIYAMGEASHNIYFVVHGRVVEASPALSEASKQELARILMQQKKAKEKEEAKEAGLSSAVSRTGSVVMSGLAGLGSGIARRLSLVGSGDEAGEAGGGAGGAGGGGANAKPGSPKNLLKAKTGGQGGAIKIADMMGVGGFEVSQTYTRSGETCSVCCLAGVLAT